jgi:cardiolipin synthase A/B
MTTSTGNPLARFVRRAGIVRLLVVLLLASAGCAQVQPHLAIPDFSLGDVSFQPTLEAVAEAPVTDGNAVDLLLNGDQFFPAQIEAIRRARKTVTYAQYYYEDGPISKELSEALAERCRAKVRVSVLLDAFGTLLMPAEHRKTMEDAGCTVATFRPLSPFAVLRTNHRNHRRILVVDGRVGFTGGAGVSWRWMGDGRTEGHWRDTMARVEGPGVRYLQGAFAENWLEATGQVLGGEPYFPRLPRDGGGARVQVIRSSPAGGSYAMYTMFLLAISSARKYIYITNPYFVPDERMMQAFLGAAHRGVEVVALLPGPIDNNIVRQASRRELGRLLKAGISVYEYRAALLHSKTMVVDGTWATIGSTNFDNRSFALNEELNLSIFSRDIASRFERIFKDDLTRSHQVTYRAWKRRGFAGRVLEFLSLPLRDQL